MFYLLLDFYVKRRTRFSVRDKRLFEIIEVEITRVDCSWGKIWGTCFRKMTDRSTKYLSFPGSHVSCPIQDPAFADCQKSGILKGAPRMRIVISSFYSSLSVGGRVVRWCWVNFQCRGVLLIWIRVGQGPTALAVGAGGGCLVIFSLL